MYEHWPQETTTYGALQTSKLLEERSYIAAGVQESQSVSKIKIVEENGGDIDLYICVFRKLTRHGTHAYKHTIKGVFEAGSPIACARPVPVIVYFGTDIKCTREMF